MNRLRVLLVEDSDSDAQLILRALRRDGYEPAFERVDSAEAMLAALARQEWDLVVCDYVMPGFGGLEALRIAKESGFDLPFILVSSKVSEEVLVEAMRAGAMDFVMKDRLERLGPAVKRELADAAARAGAMRARIEWRTALDSVQDAIFLHDAEFRVVRANLPYATLAGMPVRDVIGKPYWEVFPRAAGPLPGCRDVCAGKAGQSDEEVRLPAGEVFSSRSFPIAGTAGHGPHYLHVMQDITERNRVRDAIESSESRFRAMIENGSDLIVTIDASGLVSYASPSLEAIGGYRPSDVIGRNIMEFTWPEDVAAASQALADIVREPAEPRRAKLRWRHKDGSAVMLESVARNELSNLALKAIVINAHDVTKRSLAEKEIQRYIERLKQAMDSTIAVVSMMGEVRDPYTHGHERRVGELAAAIAVVMGLDGNRIEGIRVAGYLHDVGKIGVPAELLSRATRLTPIEFELIKGHAQQGFDILKGVEFPWPVAQIALQHHERLDGSGYPHGLKGEAIILEARIISVGDVVEAMSSHRPYRPGLGLDKALAEIERGRGTAYDPEVADACLRLVRERGFKLPD